MKFILIRHARSIANEERKIQNKDDEWKDTPLNKKGILQAKKVSERFKLEKIEKIYSSPLKRAKETAMEIARNHNMEIIFDKRLEEKNSSETHREFIQRCKEFFKEKIKDQVDSLIVSHEGVILTFLAISTNDSEEGREIVKKYFGGIANASVSIIEYHSGKFERKLIGCIKHRE